MAGVTGALGKQSAAALNGFVFYFALPALLFSFTSQAPIVELVNWNFIASILIGSLASYLLALLIGWRVYNYVWGVYDYVWGEDDVPIHI